MDSLAIPVGRIEDGKSAKCRTILLCKHFQFQAIIKYYSRCQSDYTVVVR